MTGHILFEQLFRVCRWMLFDELSRVPKREATRHQTSMVGSREKENGPRVVDKATSIYIAVDSLVNSCIHLILFGIQLYPSQRERETGEDNMGRRAGG